MKSCRNCRYYRIRCKYCFKKKIDVFDPCNGEYCSGYRDKRKICKCTQCKNMNKYSYCRRKRRCFSDEEKLQKRRCNFFLQK